MVKVITSTLRRHFIVSVAVLSVCVWITMEAFARPDRVTETVSFQQPDFFLTERVFMESIPEIISAIKKAENNPRNHGVLSVKTANPTKVIQNSVLNNYARWSAGMTPAPWIEHRPAKFIDFMHIRWAPIGAKNDPKGLNKYWAKNVRKILKRNLPEDRYRVLVEHNLI